MIRNTRGKIYTPARYRIHNSQDPQPLRLHQIVISNDRNTSGKTNTCIRFAAASPSVGHANEHAESVGDTCSRWFLCKFPDESNSASVTFVSWIEKTLRWRYFCMRTANERLQRLRPAANRSTQSRPDPSDWYNNKRSVSCRTYVDYVFRDSGSPAIRRPHRKTAFGKTTSSSLLP